MGQMMSTMVLSRKQSMMLTGGGNMMGMDGQTYTKDSINNQDITVMDTKLKILEILQVWLYIHIGFKLCNHNLLSLIDSVDTQFILNVRLDYRLAFLLSVFKKEFVEVYPMADADATSAVENAGKSHSNSNNCLYNYVFGGDLHFSWFCMI